LMGNLHGAVSVLFIGEEEQSSKKRVSGPSGHIGGNPAEKESAREVRKGWGNHSKAREREGGEDQGGVSGKGTQV